MNIFYLDENPVEAAKAHHDKHCIKMILECAQMLSTTHRLLDDNDDPILYKASFKNHPCTKWVRSSLDAYMYTYNLFRALCDEYTHRYGKIHASDSRLDDILKHPPKNIPLTKSLPPAQAMPEQYKNNSAVQAYRDYYNGEKVKLSKWTKRKQPSWVIA